MISNRWALLGLGLAVTAYSCASKEDEDDDGGGTGATAGSGGTQAGASSAAGEANAQGGSGELPGGGGAPSGGAGESAAGEAGAGAIASGISSCSTGVLFEGNPHYDTDDEYGGWNPAGQGRFEDPPLRTLGIATVGEHVYFDTNFEVWALAGDEVSRLAGDEEAEPQYQPSGPCTDVRLINTQGMTTLPNGNVAVADLTGGGIIELNDPTGDCTASPIAGNQTAILETDIEDEAGDQGDVEGDGADSKFYGIRLLTSDEDGNIYGDDSGNGKLKKIASDAKRTVTTLYDYPGADMPNLLGMTAFGGKVYVAVSTVTKDILWAIDTETGAKKDLYEGRGVFEELDASQTANLSGLTNDGESLIAVSSKGYIWRISTAGKVSPALAGMGSIVDYPEDIDLTKPVPASELPLKGNAINRSALAMLGKHILWGGRGALGLGFHVLDITCE
ncbi:MAG: hypothetical protein EOO73_02370 [Myxococcales bacterium]|nr:MAG: hypothetical protein EOO73_02370 [Myxococcales bacterium]